MASGAGVVRCAARGIVLAGAGGPGTPEPGAAASAAPTAPTVPVASPVPTEPAEPAVVAPPTVPVVPAVAVASVDLSVTGSPVDSEVVSDTPTSRMRPPAIRRRHGSIRLSRSPPNGCTQVIVDPMTQLWSSVEVFEKFIGIR
ncbi:hypothetical protein GCM10014715_31420 [Streptomyces spiralis]|uniref:Uncharacterized protein n=1 Tax=Streptomyces spiralis TaxID=66376 RepID=A0A918ZXT8_9ACTN|nr:hypothetical protein GCM10014715_31420 [Streptomyces spiralis]